LSRVFLFSLTAALNPSLLTATTVMLLLPNPKRLLLGYLLGAYTTSITVGLAIEYWLNGSGVVSTTKHTISPILDITLGLLALLLAFVIGKGELANRHRRKKADKPKKTPRWERIMNRGSARDTFVVGVLLSFPGASYLAALDAIHKQNLSTAGLVLTVVAVTVISLTLLEIPLIGYAIAPEWTPAVVDRFKAWLGIHGRRAIAIGATIIGAALILRGTLGLLA
jgi:hypothetical protein